MTRARAKRICLFVFVVFVLTVATLPALTQPRVFSIATGAVSSAVRSRSAPSIANTEPLGATTGNLAVTVSSESSNSVYFALLSSWSDRYLQKRVCTIHHAKVPGTDHTNSSTFFPEMYPHRPAVAKGEQTTNASGDDSIYTSDLPGTNPLVFDLGSYNASMDAVRYWVNIPNLSNATATVINIFCGNLGITTNQSNNTGVCDSKYEGIWHSIQDSTVPALKMSDATANANKVTAHGIWTSGQQTNDQKGWTLNFLRAKKGLCAYGQFVYQFPATGVESVKVPI